MNIRTHSSGFRPAASWALAAFTAVALPLLAVSAPVLNYQKNSILVADDQWTEGCGMAPKPVYKPHETDTSRPGFWVSSNERGDAPEERGTTSKAGITIFETGTNAVISHLEIEDAFIPVINLDGSIYGYAPPGAEGHPRHPHGIDIDQVRKLVYQVIEHSGLKWNEARNGIEIATTTDEESGLLVVYDVSVRTAPTILGGYLLGHGAEEVAINGLNGKAYVGNHEPSPTKIPAFVSVIDRSNPNAPYRFIDLPDASQGIQGIEANGPLNRVFGTTHVGERMYAFDSTSDTIAYSVDIRPGFDAYLASLPPDLQFAIPKGHVLHMHDLVTNFSLLRVYQTIHTIADPLHINEGDEENVVRDDEGTEISGRWVAEVDVNPKSATFKQVRVIDLSNGQPAPKYPTYEGNPQPDFAKRFVHTHFIAVDPVRNALFVTGEHTGNMAVVDVRTRTVRQVVSISVLMPGSMPEPPEQPVPHVHAVNVDLTTGRVYVSDEGEHGFYETVTILDR